MTTDTILNEILAELKALRNDLKNTSAATGGESDAVFNFSDDLLNVSAAAENIFEHFNVAADEGWQMTNFFTNRLKFLKLLNNEGKDGEGKHLYSKTDRTPKFSWLVIKDPFLTTFRSSNIGIKPTELEGVYNLWGNNADQFKKEFEKYLAYIRRF